MNESISEFHFDELSEEAFDAFTELGRQMSSRRQTPSDNKSVSTSMHTDGLTIPFNEIDKIIGGKSHDRETLSKIPNAKKE
jgi:hypothetical protein